MFGSIYAVIFVEIVGLGLRLLIMYLLIDVVFGLGLWLKHGF